MSTPRGKHIPGPWQVNSELPCLIQSSSRDIASTANYGAHNQSKGLETQEVKEANARLIAAAPDLLNACEEAIALLDGSTDSLLRDLARGLKALRSAVAKARGGE